VVSAALDLSEVGKVGMEDVLSGRRVGGGYGHNDPGEGGWGVVAVLTHYNMVRGW